MKVAADEREGLDIALGSEHARLGCGTFFDKYVDGVVLGDLNGSYFLAVFEVRDECDLTWASSFHFVLHCANHVDDCAFSGVMNDDSEVVM